MKISKKRLNTLIENYLFEQEEGPDSKKDKDSKEVKNMQRECNPSQGKKINITISTDTKNKKTGEVTFKVKVGEIEQESSLKIADVEGEGESKANFVLLVQGVCLALKRKGHCPSIAEELLDNLATFIDLRETPEFLPALVRYDKHFTVLTEDDINNSKLS